MDERENEMERMKEVTRLIGLTSTIDVLEFLSQRDEGTYSQLQEFVNTHTLNVRLKGLIEYGFVEHHLEKTEIRREWYTITKKGRKVLELCRELGSLVG